MRALAVLIALACAAPALAAEPAKPAPKAAAKPAAFDARDPAALVGLLATLDAKATVLGANDGVMVLDIATPIRGAAQPRHSCRGHRPVVDRRLRPVRSYPPRWTSRA